jgi:hypothetical protein
MAMQNSIWQKMGRMREKHPVSYVRRLKKPIALACIVALAAANLQVNSAVTVTNAAETDVEDSTRSDARETENAAEQTKPAEPASEKKEEASPAEETVDEAEAASSAVTEAAPEEAKPVAGGLTAKGRGYSVTVTFTEKAGLPEGTKLQVKEITGAAGSRYPESICSESYIFS